MAKYKYTEIPVTSFLQTRRWDVPPENQGQGIEVAYSDGTTPTPTPPGTLAVNGAMYKRITNYSIEAGKIGRVTYYKRAK